MTKLEIGDKAPSFTLPQTADKDVSLSDYKGRYIVLYFYPKDNTPGCTKQACGFRDDLPQFDKLDATVIGISKDSLKKHHNFTDKHDLNFPILSDENGTVCEEYGVWVEKNMYGRKYMGIERTTFLIDPDGVIQDIWRKVKVNGHIDAVRTALEDKKKAA
ncbi:MAG: thioredoxin-dependent thiol peroxidase [Alphaproteobacteria bacterium]|mgnify:CR=1 FL=1|jgi:peroxiredoxin Q/BCP|nr:thioredoxin-dependent thiol peroxidase [Alphaproteobacteria bacterium]MDP7223369.1 thioredoxin-dependent thiol peroxidase [Alphaproteobacteria bacterium]